MTKEEELEYQDSFDRISNLAKNNLLKDFVEYNSNGVIIRQFVEDMPEWIDTGQSLIHCNLVKKRLWKCTSTGWVVEQ